MTGQVYGKYKITDHATQQYSWHRAKCLRNAIEQYARRYHNVSKTRLDVRRRDLNTYALRRKTARGLPDESPFAVIIVN